MAKVEPLIINDISIAAGERCIIDLPLPRLQTHMPMTMPLHVIRGKKDGPTLFVTAAIHGDELNGVEIIRRLLALRILQKMRGTLLVVPIVNIYGALARSRYLPDRRDLNRSFPGSGSGSIAARVASTLFKSIITKSDFGIDLHTGALHLSNLPQVRANVLHPLANQMGRIFGVPVLIHSPMRDGSLREAANEHDIPILVYEAGEALRLEETAIRTGLKGILNVMRGLGMLSTRQHRRMSDPFVAHSTKWHRAPESGLFQLGSKLGAKVLKGEQVGSVHDPITGAFFPVVAKVDGVVIGKTAIPLVHEGDAIFNVARFEEDLDDVAEQAEAFIP